MASLDRDLSDEDIAKAQTLFQNMYDSLAMAHDNYVGSKAGEEEPGDLAYMDGPSEDAHKVAERWAVWVRAKEEAKRVALNEQRVREQEAEKVQVREEEQTARTCAREDEERKRQLDKLDEADRRAFEKNEQLTALRAQLETGIASLGDPEKDLGDFIESGINPAAL